MSIAQKLYSLRVDNDITQAELAKKLGVERKTISRAETGKTEPKVELLIKYAQFFKVSMDYITELKDNQSKSIKISNKGNNNRFNIKQ